MEFQFDPRQPYQTSAIEAVVDLFDGQPADSDQLLLGLVTQTPVGEMAPLDYQEPENSRTDLAREIGAYGNNLVLDEDTIAANLSQRCDNRDIERNVRA